MASEDDEFTMLFQDFYPESMPLSGVFIGRPRKTGARSGAREFPATSSHGVGNAPAGVKRASGSIAWRETWPSTSFANRIRVTGSLIE